MTLLVFARFTNSFMKELLIFKGGITMRFRKELLIFKGGITMRFREVREVERNIEKKILKRKN